MPGTLSLAEAERLVYRATDHESGLYFLTVEPGREIGSGVVYDSVTYTVYSEAEDRFRVATGPVLVLTHECDVERGNLKVFNNDIIFIPVVDFAACLSEILAKKNDDDAKGFLGDLARGRISQLMYLPPWPPKWPHGSVLYFNRIASSHYSQFKRTGVEVIGILTDLGFLRLKVRLSDHLFRDKADPLPEASPAQAGPRTLLSRLWGAFAIAKEVLDRRH
jgi:hypothetical protein